MSTVSAPQQRKKIHPHKFALWVAMGSIAMMFAGLTSGYLVRQAQGNWRYFNMPVAFWISTAIILLSSFTIFAATRAFKQRQMPRYRSLMLLTILLGIAFMALQFYGFYELYTQKQPYRMNGIVTEAQVVRLNGNPSESFLLIIAGLHIAHIFGGVIAMLVVYFRTISKKVKIYNATGLEIAGSYWHFVDILWIYLFVFFLANQ